MNPPTVPQRSPITLAELLDLSEEDLAQPVARLQPLEQEWMDRARKSGGHMGGDAPEASLQGIPSTELIPGLGAPGAVEVPVYLAAQRLQELMQHDAGGAVPDAPPVPLGMPGDAWALPPAPEVAAAAVDDLDELVEATPASEVTVGPAKQSQTPTVSGRVLTPKSPPAIAQPGEGHIKKPMDPPAANFAVTQTDTGVLAWPSTRQKGRPAKVRDTLCTKCGGRFNGKICKGCGFDINAERPEDAEGQWRGLNTAFLESDSRVVRTIGAFLFAPGDLTRAYLIRFRRRYIGPTTLVVVATLLWAVVSTMASIRPRPDRAIMVGAERTVEASPGLVALAHTAIDEEPAPNLMTDIAATLADIPVLWFPLMAAGVYGVVWALRYNKRKRDRSEVVFTAHFITWFVLLGALIVPLVLAMTKFGFEWSAASQGITRIRYTGAGDIDGLSQTWNDLRRFVITPGFHSSLMAIGLIPWAVVAWKRAFKTTWEKAIACGFAIALIPLLLLTPFR